MIEWKAVFIYLPMLIFYILYRIKTKKTAPVSEQENITTNTKLLIAELNILTE